MASREGNPLEMLCISQGELAIAERDAAQTGIHVCFDRSQSKPSLVKSPQNLLNYFARSVAPKKTNTGKPVALLFRLKWQN